MKIKELKFNKKKLPIKEIVKKSKEFYSIIKKRRSIRNFSKSKINDNIIENAILSAGSAPSGANLQPWHFVVVKDLNIKKKIRIAAEKEEKEWEKMAKEKNLDITGEVLKDCPF